MSNCPDTNLNDINRQKNIGLSKQTFSPLRDPSLSRVVKSLRELPFESRVIYSNNTNQNAIFKDLRTFEQINLYEGYLINKYTYKVIEAYLLSKNEPKKTIENICDVVLLSNSDITLCDSVSKIAFYFIDKVVQGEKDNKDLSHVRDIIDDRILSSTTRSIFKEIKSGLNENFAFKYFYNKPKDLQPKIKIKKFVVDEARTQLFDDKKHYDKILGKINSILNDESISSFDSIPEICKIILNDEESDFLGKIKLQSIYEIKMLLYRASKQDNLKTLNDNQKKALKLSLEFLNEKLNNFTEEEIILKIYDTFRLLS